MLSVASTRTRAKSSAIIAALGAICGPATKALQPVLGLRTAEMVPSAEAADGVRLSSIERIKAFFAWIGEC